MGTKAIIYTTTALVIALDLTLLGTGIITGPQAVAAFITAEIIIAAAMVLVTTRTYRKTSFRAGTTPTIRGYLDTVLPRPAAAAVAHELNVIITLARFITRRRPKTPGTTFTYRRGLAPLLTITAVASVLELVAVHYLIPWPAARLIAGLIGIYALLWTAALWAGTHVHPHRVDDVTLQLNFSHMKHLPVPRALIHDARVDTSMSPATWWKPDTDGTLHAPVGNITNVHITLTETLATPHGPVAAIRVAVDNPEQLVDHLTATHSTT